MGQARERLMNRDERRDAESVFRSIVGLRAAGRPIEDPAETAVKCARLGLQLVRHAQAIEEMVAAMRT